MERNTSVCYTQFVYAPAGNKLQLMNCGQALMSAGADPGRWGGGDAHHWDMSFARRYASLR